MPIRCREFPDDLHAVCSVSECVIASRVANEAVQCGVRRGEVLEIRSRGWRAYFLLIPGLEEMRMKAWNANFWLAALALQLPPSVMAAEYVPAAPVHAAAVSKAAPAPAPEPPTAVGTLTVQWTISGRRDPIDCGGLGVDRLELSVRAAPGDEDQADGPCDAFQISLDLAPGTYNGDVVLLDRLNRPVTLAVPLEQVDIVAGREVLKSVDFPVAAFL